MEQEILDKAVSLRHQLHMYPCISEHEQQTKDTLISFLKENTSLKITDMGKWFFAEYHPEKSTGSIAFRADMDALKMVETTNLPYKSRNKGAAHKCGHDGHSASLAAFAVETYRNGCSKDVYFIFQHAEETGAGGEECAALLKEKNIDEVYAIHNFPQVKFGALGIREGTICCASKGMEIKFKGTSAHASQPEKGRNPAKAISRVVLELDRIADPKRYKGLILATVVQVDLGERAFGISAYEGRLLLTIRGQNEAEMLSMQKEIEDFSKKAACEDGLEVSFSFYEEFPETYDHKESIEKIRRIAKEKNFPLYEMKDPIRSSEDFGYYTKNTKGAMIWMGAGENSPALHSNDYDFNDKLIERFNALFDAILRS